MVIIAIIPVVLNCDTNNHISSNNDDKIDGSNDI